MQCPKCNSKNVSIQAVSVTKDKKHSLAWWLLLGWWVWIFWLIAFVPMLIITAIKGKKVVIETHSEAVCQNCGYRWETEV